MKSGGQGMLCSSLWCSLAAQGMIAEYLATLGAVLVGMCALVAEDGKVKEQGG